MSIWYESQLLELGVEDLQSLASANLVDLLLQKRIPVARLVDWVDQSILLLHLDEPGQKGLAPKLRQLGIRTATDLLAAFPAEEMESMSEPTGSTKATLHAAADLGVDATTLHSLVHYFASEPTVAQIRGWKHVDTSAV